MPLNHNAQQPKTIFITFNVNKCCLLLTVPLILIAILSKSKSLTAISKLFEQDLIAEVK